MCGIVANSKHSLPGQFDSDKHAAKEPAALPTNEAEVKVMTVAFGCPVARERYHGAFLLSLLEKLN